MIEIKECNVGKEIFFQEIHNFDNQINSSAIHVKAIAIEKNNETYLTLYTSDMQLHSESFIYMNIALKNKSLNTRLKAMEALKFLICFEEIIEKPILEKNEFGKMIFNFSKDDITNLKAFLMGRSFTGQYIKFELKTVRSNATVNGYLSIYRSYLEYLGINKDENPLRDNSAASFALPIHSTAEMYRKEHYKSSVKLPSFVDEVPMYISVNDFAKILNIIRNKYTAREEIIVRLMFECGLRIGEVLGLTADDIVTEKNPIDGTYFYRIYIRNRFTDRKDQQAKTCMKIQSRAQYSERSYDTEGYGYQTVLLNRDLYDLIDEYIEDVHVKAQENDTTSDRYFKKTVADRVSRNNDQETPNFYIFINSIGTPINVISWNEILRRIITDAGLAVDKDKRKHNLNHGFRHGFAMYHVQYLHTEPRELARLLRHSNLNSVLCYYRPTLSDKIATKADFTESLYSQIPDLKN